MRTVVIVCALTCAACTTGAYQPGVGQLTDAAKTVGTVVSDDAVELRHEYRVSLLNTHTAGSAVDLAKFVCEPLAYTAQPLGSSGEVAGFGGAAADVAQPPPPSFWNGIAGLFNSYELPVPKTRDEMKSMRADTFDACAGDVAGVPKVNAFLIDRVGTTAVAGGRSMGEAVSGIIEIVGPAVTEVLAVVDEHRRAAALRDYFSDQAKVARLREHIVALTEFSATMDEYRRLRAMEAVAQAVQSPEPGTAAIEAATKYDVTFAAQLGPAFAAMGQSVDDLERIANGEDEAVLIRSSFVAARRTLHAIECLQQLTNDKAKKEKLQGLIDQLMGRDPNKPRRPKADAPKSAEPAGAGAGD